MNAVQTQTIQPSPDQQASNIAVASGRGKCDHEGSLDAGLAEPVRFKMHGASNGLPVVVLGGISADRSCDRWWRAVAGPGGALDPRRYRLISIDWMMAGQARGRGVSTREDAIDCPVELVGVPSDDLVPLDQLRQLAGMVGFGCRLHVIDSPYGHDAFLKSPELINPLLERLLASDREVVHGIA